MAWFSNSRDAVVLREKLITALGKFDHSTLPDRYWRGEDLARAIGIELSQCQEVIVSREPEGIFAQWIKDPD